MGCTVNLDNHERAKRGAAHADSTADRPIYLNHVRAVAHETYGTAGMSDIRSSNKAPINKPGMAEWGKVHEKYQHAQSLEKSDPATAAKLYQEVLAEAPGDPAFRSANFFLGDYQQQITGKEEAALPYYRKALFRQDGKMTTALPAAIYFKSALIFGENGDLSTAKQAYNHAAAFSNSEYTIAFPLPLATDQTLSQDLACYVRIGYVQSSGNNVKLHDARTHLETALNIKDCDVSRFYLGWFQHEYPAAWAREIKNNPPSPEFQKKFDQAKFTYMAKRSQR